MRPCTSSTASSRSRQAVVEAFDARIEFARTGHVDNKTELQEALARSGNQVQYVVLDVEGPPHDRRFVCVRDDRGRAGRHRARVDEEGRGAGGRTAGARSDGVGAGRALTAAPPGRQSRPPTPLGPLRAPGSSGLCYRTIPFGRARAATRQCPAAARSDRGASRPAEPASDAARAAARTRLYGSVLSHYPLRPGTRSDPSMPGRRPLRPRRLPAGSPEWLTGRPSRPANCPRAPSHDQAARLQVVRGPDRAQARARRRRRRRPERVRQVERRRRDRMGGRLADAVRVARGEA